MAEAKNNSSLPLSEADPEVYQLLKEEEKRQFLGLELIASENFTSRAVLEAVGSAFTNKYSEGLPGARYYGGNEVIDQLESLCQKRALAAFNVDSKEWAVNVQPYSGSVGNLAAFVSVLKPNDRVMGLDLPSGGHLSHGFYKGHNKVNASSIFYESLPYKVNADTGLVDYDELEKLALLFSPKLIVCGGSAYPRDWDYARVRAIADKVKALMLVDMAHYSGLVAAQVVANPFEFADLVTTTTHKSLRGPRAAMIFSRVALAKAVNQAVFPALQGGPHNNAIAGICVQLKQVASQEFKEYAQQVVKNSRCLGQALIDKGYKLVSGGTDTHLVLWDLRKTGLLGKRMEIICEHVAITLNKNSIYGDASAVRPGGVRLGTPALTSRGFKEEDFKKVADYLDRALKLGVSIRGSIKGKKIADFRKALKDNKEVEALRAEIQEYARKFYMPGFDTSKY